MNHQEAQEREELDAFRYFAEHFRPDIMLKSIEKREPPEPDILCCVRDEGYVAFEVVSFTNPEIRREVAHLLKHPEGSGKNYMRLAGPVDVDLQGKPNVLQRKLAKTYKTEYPIELLCYAMEQLIQPPDVVVPTMKVWFENDPNTGPFRHIWYMCGDSEEECCERIA